jgi:hypothetical protein
MASNGQAIADTAHPMVRKEVIAPLHKNSFNNDTCKEKKQGGNPQIINGYLTFNGDRSGNRQVDPQIAVGGGYIFHGTNGGLFIYNKKGEYISGVSQKCFNDGIDPKMFFDVHNRVFVFDLWWYYDKAKLKPVNVSVSETDNPTGAWNTYAISETTEVDGGGIGYSKKWIGYSFPGGEQRTFVLRTAEAKAGKPATVYHFKGTLGHPVSVQDDTDDLYFFEITETNFIIRKVSEDKNGEPFALIVADVPHQLNNFKYPPQSQQKGTAQRISSGDRNPKNLVLQNGSIWFSQAINANGRSAVQWHQLNATTGNVIQTGIIKSDTTNYIQTTLAVNKKNDVLIGFQQIDSTMFVSPRFAYRFAKDKPGTVREIVPVGEGQGAADGVAWGDYSGSIIDGDDFTTLWTVQSIANEKGRGETVIVKVPFDKKMKKKKHK